jgi:hypothetical protein
MKITIPENIKDITLRQLQDITLFASKEGVTELQVSHEKIRVITGIDLSTATISQNDFEDLIESIDKALNTPADFQKTFKMNGVDFGFHPNLDNMSSDEYYDLMEYGDNTETLHNLMAILFRPIDGKDKFGNYKIETYEGTEESKELMKDMPLNLVNGALVFFFNLSKELRLNIHKSLKEMEAKREKKHRNSLRSGVGIPLWWSSLRGTF